MLIEVVAVAVGARVVWSIRQAVVKHEYKQIIKEENNKIVRQWRQKNDTGRHDRLEISREIKPPVFAAPTVRYRKEYPARVSWWRRAFLGEDE